MSLPFGKFSIAVARSCCFDKWGIGAEVVVGEEFGDAVDVVVEPGDDSLGARWVGVAEAFVKGEGASEEWRP